MDNLIKSILKCSNIDEVTKVIDNNSKCLLVKAFNFYVLVLVVHPESKHYITFKSVLFDMKSKTYVVEHHSGKYIENFEEEYSFCSKENGEYSFHFTSGVQRLKPHVSPKGNQYKIKVKHGESGGGGDWSKDALGLNQRKS